MVLRLLILAALAMIAGVGCNAGTSGGQLRQPAPVTRETLTKTRIISQINKNAEAIKSLEAEPAIEASSEGDSHNLKGRMRMERDKDFRLYITAFNRPVADIGSNEKGFWFWVKDQDRKANNIYTCDYQNVGSSRLAVTMQPEWIMEAMGLRPISQREAASMDARKGDVSGQLLLTQFRTGSDGATYTKETLVNETNGAIIEHRLYAGAKTELLARATIKSYKNKVLTSTEEDGSEVRVSLPERFTLEWVAEKFKLEISMGEPRVNPKFSPKQVADFFVEPTIPGANRIDLASVGQTPPTTTSRLYESSPRSESALRSGIRLGQPKAVPSNEGATATRSSSPRSDPSSALTNAMESPSETTVVGAPIPQGSSTDPAAVRASSRGNWQRPVFEN